MMSSTPLNSRSNSRPKIRSLQHGVSLLEILISITLTMVLLTSIWSLADLLGRRFESQLQQAEANQILRSLEQQLSQDLANLMSDAIAVHQLADPMPAVTRPAADSPETATGISGTVLSDSSAYSANSAGWLNGTISPAAIPSLRGSDRQLEILVFTDPLELSMNQLLRDLRESSPTDAEVLTHNPTPLIRLVRYRGVLPPASGGREDDFDLWTDEVESLLPENSSAESLAREETPFDSAEPVLATSQFPESLPPSTSSAARSRLGSADMGNSESNRADPRQRESIPEIQDYRFSYFDGFQWRSSWNSHLDRGLPQAIRLEFNLQKPNSATGDRKLAANREREPFSRNLSRADQRDRLSSDRAETNRSEEDDNGRNELEHSLIFVFGPSKNPSSDNEPAGPAEFRQTPIPAGRGGNLADPF
jgi:Tfp pilus assembly protein PilV